MPDTVGIIGMGVMGKPMARNLLKAGFSLIVHNRHQEVTDTFVALGAHAASQPSAIAAQCDVVITLLPTSADVEQVVAGSDGIIEAAHDGLTVIDNLQNSFVLRYRPCHTSSSTHS